MKYIFVFLIFLLVISIALAEDTTPPEFSDPYPEDDSYVLGGDRTFSINITEDNLDTSTVKLYIKSIDSTEWDTYSLTCVDNGIWYCSATVSLDIVGSDTIEQFYFEANDTYDNYASYGNATNPLLSLVDKKVYSIGYGVLFACLDTTISREEVEALAMGIIDWYKELKPSGDTQVVFRDSAFDNDISKTNMTAILEQNGINHVRSL